MTLEIRQHAPGPDTGDFIRADSEVLGREPKWIPEPRTPYEQAL